MRLQDEVSGSDQDQIRDPVGVMVRVTVRVRVESGSELESGLVSALQLPHIRGIGGSPHCGPHWRVAAQS